MANSICVEKLKIEWLISFLPWIDSVVHKTTWNEIWMSQMNDCEMTHQRVCCQLRIVRWKCTFSNNRWVINKPVVNYGLQNANVLSNNRAGHLRNLYCTRSNRIHDMWKQWTRLDVSNTLISKFVLGELACVVFCSYNWN